MIQNAVILDKKNNFITHYGTTLSERFPSVLFLRTKSKITPLSKKAEYNSEIKSIKENFKLFVNNTITNSNNVENDYIFNVDISSKGVNFGKTSFLRYDLYVRPSKRRTVEENKNCLQQLSLKFDNELERLLNDNGITCK